MRIATIMLAIGAGFLVSLGLVAIISSEIEIGWLSSAGQQVIFFLLGLTIMGLLSVMDYRQLRWTVWPAFLIALLLMLAALHWRAEGTRASRWVDFGWGIPFQPSEFAKLALILVLAWYGERYQRYMPTFWRGFMVPGLAVGAVLVVLYFQRDFGTLILMGAVGGAIMLVAGTRWWHLLPAAAASLPILGLLLLIDPHGRVSRVLDWWNKVPGIDGRWQVEQAMLTLGNGGVYGLGPGQGEFFGRVPLYWSDFVLALIGEEFGLVGTLLVVVAFAMLVVAGVMIAWNARDTFGFLLASGVALLIGLQAFINIGVVTDTIPNTGIALPFLSKGGSSLLVMLVMVGLLFSIGRTTAREQVAELNPETDPEESGAFQPS